MPLSTEREVAGQAESNRARSDTLARWNRRIHYGLGLYLLFFAWLFAVTGLLLNHSQWKFAEFWESRKETSEERAIQPPAPGGDLAQTRDLMRQLGIRGEIEWTTTRSDVQRLDFRVNRPGSIWDIKADLARNRAALKHIDLNAWGIMRVLHSFTGVRTGDSRNDRDWFLTSLWAWTMDAVAAGLILMVLSGYYMWWLRPQKRRGGIIVLAVGFLTCGLFCFGLRWFY